MSLFVIIPCNFWAALYIVVHELMEPNRGLWDYLKKTFQRIKDTGVYWLPKAGGKEKPAARQLVHFTFTYGDTRKSKPTLQLETIRMKSWDYGPSLPVPKDRLGTAFYLLM